ncbi:MAG TPA: hypothetical protein VL361_19935 [Candidatus Limnocylindrales bacterium]|jgi:hypothetical protein|nr:hypothetical protein [Candidatus Limnocylindrales bacterium]
MKRASFKLQSVRGGWIRTTLAPINDKHQSTFGVSDALMLTAVVALVITVARLCLAH